MKHVDKCLTSMTGIVAFLGPGLALLAPSLYFLQLTLGKVFMRDRRFRDVGKYLQLCEYVQPCEYVYTYHPVGWAIAFAMRYHTA